MRRKHHTTQFNDSSHSSKCTGRGNGRTWSVVTKRLRRQLNKMRRQFLKRDLDERQSE